MNILIKGDEQRYKRYSPGLEIERTANVIFADRDADDDTVLSLCPNADIIFADAISSVSERLMRGMKNLKLVHSEGVAFNKIDTDAAKSLGIYVCNNKGANAASVAEQAVFLMLCLLRTGLEGDKAVRTGHQIEMKERRMVEGITDLANCTVGIVGLGDIGLATAKLLAAFGCSLCYYSPHRKSCSIEQEYGLMYTTLDELLKRSDIVSLHMAVTPQTAGIVNAGFLSQMKKSSYLINTARGDLIDNEALRNAIIEGRIAGAGLDTVSPEPVTADNPLVTLPAKFSSKIVFSPHLGGITTGSFMKMHRTLWENAERIALGERPINIVNGL